MNPSDPELRRLFERSPIAHYRTTPDGRFLAVNPALVALLGYATSDELLALHIDRDVYVDPHQRPGLIERIAAEGGIAYADVEWKTKLGGRLRVRVFPHRVADEHGTITFDVAAFDITELTAANDTLREQQERLAQMAATVELVMRQMSGLYWRVDRDLRLVSVGGPVLATLGYPADRHLGKTLHEVHLADPSSVDPVLSHERALAGEIVAYPSHYHGKYLANTIGPMYDAQGNICGAIGACLDVTASHLLEQRMIDAQRAESLGVLAGGLAHDFNNLLVAILGNADLARREIGPGVPGRAAIDNIRDAALRAAELTDQLLAYAGRGGTATTRVVIAPIVDELLRIAAPSLPANLKIVVDLPAEVAVRGDATQVRQTLLNLISNAREAIGEAAGTIAITARAAEHDGKLTADDVLGAEPGSYIWLAVTDDGPGIARDQRRRVFEPFFTTKATGNGLGLASVLGIVRAHGGGIRVTSQPGHGARFEVAWPADRTAGASAAGSSDRLAAAARTVLVVDDEDLVRDVLARMIVDLGYAAITAGDGRAALDRIEHEHVDALLVDLTMPTMSGAELISKVRTRWPSLPIVLCSGYDRDRRGPVAADAYLPKPFRIDALEGVLAKLLPV